ncbi:hypothetical protein Tco_0662310, partial [Tanacetum coccineum]
SHGALDLGSTWCFYGRVYDEKKFKFSVFGDWKGSYLIGRQEQAMERLKENSGNWKFVLLVNLLILPAYTCVVTDVVLLCFVLLGNEQSRG